MNKSIVIGILMSCVVALIPVKSNAILLNAGDTAFLPGTTAAMEPELAGVVISDNSIYDSIVPGGNNLFQVGIDVTNRVTRSNVNNSLIFAPRLVPTLNNTTGNFLVDQVVIAGFSDFVLDVNYRSDGLGDRGPNTATRSADGNELSFDFLFPLSVANLFANPQEQSYFLSINSNATAYTNTGSMSIFGRHIDYPGETFEFTYAGLAVPVNEPVAVSEPPLTALFVIFLSCLMVIRRS